jgi:hypothetical protein
MNDKRREGEGKGGDELSSQNLRREGICDLSFSILSSDIIKKGESP